ncbi:pancreas/duodenum homeobox protein 1 [uncultured Mailhella sp.]|uniref:pancreas/duodenum homeobox protein 1 n=1 Tax=uncultured Mailhella sp. TaxID=1981031 RepID=UPI002618CC28|nr:pancreas/duodenum homeobox protein 1 [uncultured Mailhella sp.]
MSSHEEIFSPACLNEVFPPERTDQFFEALFGDAEDGAYDIRLSLLSGNADTLKFLFELHQRGHACLACNLTHGLPAVFLRHPVINIRGVTAELARRVGWEDGTWTWSLGDTEEVSTALHVIPLVLTREK